MIQQPHIKGKGGFIFATNFKPHMNELTTNFSYQSCWPHHKLNDKYWAIPTTNLIAFKIMPQCIGWPITQLKVFIQCILWFSSRLKISNNFLWALCSNICLPCFNVWNNVTNYTNFLHFLPTNPLIICCQTNSFTLEVVSFMLCLWYSILLPFLNTSLIGLSTFFHSTCF